MKQPVQKLKFTTTMWLVPVLLVFTMVVLYWAAQVFKIDLHYYGIYPKRWIALRGIFTSPFIHGSLKHLFNNMVPLFVLTTALFYFYRSVKWRVLLLGTLLTGLATWVIGRPSWHIGASGIIYLLTSFLLFKGIFSKQYQLTALSFAVIFLYGGFIWYVFPVDPKISWEGHLSGFFVGFLFALIFNEKTIQNKKYDWEQDDFNPEEDPFISQFDEEGNFIEIPKEEPFDDLVEANLLEEKPLIKKVIYTFKKKEPKDEKF